MPNCYYYDEQRNRCNCYVNENLNELLAENARLRSELESVGTAAYLYGRNDLKAENAKLRGLVVRMYKSIRWSDMTSDSMFSVAHSYEKDMRELRIEVNDGAE